MFLVDEIRFFELNSNVWFFKNQENAVKTTKNTLKQVFHELASFLVDNILVLNPCGFFELKERSFGIVKFKLRKRYKKQSFFN